MKKFYAFFLAAMVCMVAGVSAQAADWFISGAFQGWAHCQAAYKFTETSAGVYTLDLSTTPKSTISGAFVIVQGTVGTPDWGTKIGSNGAKVKADTPYSYRVGGGDFSMEGSVENAVITIDTNAGTLLVAGQAQENQYNTVYLVGDFGGGWSEDNTSYPMSLEAGSQTKWTAEYTLSAATSYFKMKAGNNVYGTGGDDIAVVLNTPYTASMSGNAFSIAAGTYTFTFDLPYNGETGVLTVTSNGVTPPPTPEDDEFGLVGTLNEWNIDNLIPMTKTDAGFVYTAESLAAGTEFKIGTIGKGWNDSFGAEADGEAVVDVTVGTAMNAWKGSSNNFKIVNDLTDVTITFTYVAAGPCTLLVEGTEGGDTPEVEFGLVGTFNEWNIENLVPMTKTEGAFVYNVASLAAGTEFKVGTIGKGWDDTFGAESESESPVTVNLQSGEEANAWKGSSHNFGIDVNLTDVTITFTYVAAGPSKIMIEGTEQGEEGDKNITATYNFELQYQNVAADEWTADGNNRYIEVNGVVMYPYSNVISAPTREGSNSVTLVSNVNTGTTGTAARIYQGNDGNIELRVYKNTTTTITAPAGYSISSIEVGGKVSKSTLKLANLVVKTDGWTVADVAAEDLPAGMSAAVVYTPADVNNTSVEVSFEPTGTVRMGYVTVKAVSSATGVEETFTVEVEAPAEYYNLQGVRVNNPSAGIYIRRQGNTVSKVIIR